jgi:hypothetical protein
MEIVLRRMQQLFHGWEKLSMDRLVNQTISFKLQIVKA